MARHYLQLEGREIPVTDEQVKQFNENRSNPGKIAELRAMVLEGAGKKSETVKMPKAPSVQVF